MKNFVNNLVALYTTNPAVHSLLTSLEFALVGYVVSYKGGLPTSAAAWTTIGTAVGGLAWGVFRGWLQSTVLSKAKVSYALLKK